MSKLSRITDSLRRAGALETALFLGLSAASRGLSMQVLQIVAITAQRLNPAYLELGGGFEAGFVDSATLLEQAARCPELEMPAGFVRAAQARGDRCYGITVDGCIVSYGWYTNRPTAICDGLELHFDPGYVYMYKGFTRPEHRGLRLHAIGMTRALDAICRQGFSGLVSFVERTNLASLKSVYRMGYAPVAKVAVAANRRGAYRIVRIGRHPRPEVSVRRVPALAA